MKIFIQHNELYEACIRYTLEVFALNKGITLRFVSERGQADLVVAEDAPADLPIAIDFYHSLSRGQYAHGIHFKKDCLVYDSQGRADLLATCFYMINSLQEYDAPRDKIGRFPFAQSYQQRFGNADQNLVQQYFDRLATHVKFSPHVKPAVKSAVFLSHDIDNINNAWLEDGFAALRRGNIPKLLSLLTHAAAGKPDWFNLDKVMTVHDERGLKSTFFWLANKGKASNGMKNADYDVRSPKVQEAIGRVAARGFVNGIHKSAEEESFAQESGKLGFEPFVNRYHFLRFSLPGAYASLEQAGIKVDASLGFSEQMGFRNSYGQPFQPFDVKAKRVHDLVEVPLHVMDRTFWHQRVPATAVAERVIGFLESNRYNCVLSVLWHNNFFSSLKYDGYLDAYKKIIAYLYENDMPAVSPQAIHEKYRLSSS
jgi:hypothetical protein